MISRLYHWWNNRHIRRGFSELERHTRASTKLTPGYERRRIRDLRIARERFENNTAGSKLA